MSARYPTAVEREKAKLAGAEPHPADQHDDPLAAKLATPPTEERRAPVLKHLGGSDHDAFNVAIANSVVLASRGGKDVVTDFVGFGLRGVDPKDEVEGMLAAQMIAAHHASMECFRRAMLDNQTIEGRAMNLSHAGKLSRTYASLMEALNKHRGKSGEQRVVVEHVHRHVHVHENGRAIVDHSDTPGTGAQIEKASQPHAQQAISYALQPSLRSEDAERDAVSRAGDGERSLPDARWREPGRSEGRG